MIKKIISLLVFWLLFIAPIFSFFVYISSVMHLKMDRYISSYLIVFLVVLQPVSSVFFLRKKQKKLKIYGVFVSVFTAYLYYVFISSISDIGGAI